MACAMEWPWAGPNSSVRRMSISRVPCSRSIRFCSRSVDILPEVYAAFGRMSRGTGEMLALLDRYVQWRTACAPDLENHGLLAAPHAGRDHGIHLEEALKRLGRGSGVSVCGGLAPDGQREVRRRARKIRQAFIGDLSVHARRVELTLTGGVDRNNRSAGGWIVGAVHAAVLIEDRALAVAQREDGWGRGDNVHIEGVAGGAIVVHLHDDALANAAGELIRRDGVDLIWSHVEQRRWCTIDENRDIVGIAVQRVGGRIHLPKQRRSWAQVRTEHAKDQAGRKARVGEA